jgi:8-oxo-dGTP pyrophosphatase MutT (NUDIX family)
MIKPWTTIDSKPTGNYRIFTVRTDRKKSPRTGAEHEFYVIDCANWVNVIATTPDNQLVMIEQYRHGTNTVELEIPGGMIDQKDATPAIAGARELREETGYEGEEPVIIGSIYPNPAIMSNTCHTLFVKNCRSKHPVEWDQAEDLVTRLVPVSNFRRLIATGQIRHSLVVVALYHFELFRAAR